MLNKAIWSDTTPSVGAADATPNGLTLANTNKRVAVVGLGYVGLPTALSFDAAGVRVTGVDISERRVAAIRKGNVDLLEVDHARLASALDENRLELTSSAGAISAADVVFICVPTPVDEHLAPDLGAVRSACESVVAHARAGQTIILTSTSFVGTTEQMLVEPLEAAGFVVGSDIFVAFSPERVDPGNDRFPQDKVTRVVGGVTPECGRRAESMIRFIAPKVHVVSSTRAAELTKLYENTFRAVNITLANEMADIAKSLQVSVDEIIEAAATKPYGFMPFYPGPGVGGHCLPCDPHYLLWQLKANRTATPLIEQAMTSIAYRPGKMAARIADIAGQYGHAIAGARILVVGVAYKPDVQDVRETPAAEIIGELQARGARVDYYDPLVPSMTDSRGTTHLSVGSADHSGYDVVVVHTLHKQIDVAAFENAPLIVDASYRARMLPARITP